MRLKKSICSVIPKYGLKINHYYACSNIFFKLQAGTSNSAIIMINIYIYKLKKLCKMVLIIDKKNDFMVVNIAFYALHYNIKRIIKIAGLRS